jgi:hypothetical protein
MASHCDDVGDLTAKLIKTRSSRGFCVGDSSVDGVADYSFGVQPAAYGVGFHSNSNQIIAAKAVQSFVSANSHASILRFLAEKKSGVVESWFFRGILHFLVCLLW